MSDPVMVLPLAYQPAPNAVPMPVAWIVRRDGLWFRNGKKPSLRNSLAATRTSITISSATSVGNGVWSSLVPVEMRFRVASGRIRYNIGENTSLTSLTFGYTDVASGTWSEWEPVHRMLLDGRKMFAQAPAGAGAFQYEIRCARKQTN